MSLPGSGCCCGIIVGFVLAVLLAVTGTIGVYCWMNPEARRSGVSAVQKVWRDFKSFGDDLVGEVKDVKMPDIPEPKLTFK